MEMVKPTNEFAVICHGDLWLSNILFKYGMPICCAGGCGGSIDALVTEHENNFFWKKDQPLIKVKIVL
jgi:thiamine kinase-like enzyme